MKQNCGNYLAAQIDLDGGKGTAGTSRTDPTSFELASAKARVNAEFDRLSQSISASADRTSGFDASEIARLLAILEEKRCEELATAMSMDWIRSWRLNGRAQNLLLNDSRAALIYKARNERRLPSADRPVRYFGFVDEGAFRVFRFGRLPDRESSPKYRVSVSLAFFSRGKVVLQDGPGLCAAILARRAEPDDCVATVEDLDNFLASRTQKTADKRRVKR